MITSNPSYNVTNGSDFIRITDHSFQPITIQYQGTHFSVTQEERDTTDDLPFGNDDTEKGKGKYGLFETRSLIGDVMDRIHEKSWSRLDEINPNRDDYSQIHYHLYTQCLEETTEMQADLEPRCIRLRSGADRDVLLTQKAVNDITGECPDFLMRESAYEHRWLIEDLQTYRAACIAAKHIRDLAPEHLQFDAGELIAMENWRGLFSPNGKSYSSLEKTLVNLPDGIPPNILPCLKNIWLPRPLTESLELLTTLYFLAHASPQKGGRHENMLTIIVSSRSDEIKRMVAQVGSYLGKSLDHTNSIDVKGVVDFLIEYPDDAKSTIVGLTNTVIGWHREKQEQERVKMTDRTSVNIQHPLLPDRVPGIPQYGVASMNSA